MFSFKRQHIYDEQVTELYTSVNILYSAVIIQHIFSITPLYLYRQYSLIKLLFIWEGVWNKANERIFI